MIGLFDSGLGGLTVLRRVRERFPDVDVLYFADQAHVPYGERAPDDLFRLLQHNLAWLDARSVDAIVMACNTSCAIADLYGWPSVRAEVLDLLDAATIALQRENAKRIGVVATAATVRSGAYGRRIRNAIPQSEVWEVPAPALVPLVEAGAQESGAARDAVAAYCAELPDDLDAVVLACTHYPILEPQFRVALGERVALIDPAFVQAQRLGELLSHPEVRGAERAKRGEAPSLEGSGRTHYVTSGDPERFRLSIAQIMEEPQPAIVEY